MFSDPFQTDALQTPQDGVSILSATTRLLLLGACVIAFYFAGLGAVPLLEPDEGRYAEISREMLATGDLVTPHLDGVPYFEKPPLYYWLGAGSLRVLGHNEFALRFWSALFGVGGVALAYALARTMGGLQAGTDAAVILGTAPLHVLLSRANLIDSTLSFFIDGALVCFWLAHRREGRAAVLLWHGVFLAGALAVLSKGLIGILLPAAVIGLYVLVTGQWKILRQAPWLTGVALFLAIALPWHVIAARRNPDFLWFYFVHEHLLRYTTSEADRRQPFWFFAAVLVPGLLPWWGLLPGAARLLGPLATLRRKPHLVFLAVWAGFVLVFFSASESKLVPYVLPSLVPLAVFAALALDAEADALRRWGMVASSTGLLVAAAAFVWLSLGRTLWLDGEILPVVCLLATISAVASLGSILMWLRRERRRGFILAALSAAALAGCFPPVAAAYGEGHSTKRAAAFLRERLLPGDGVFCYRHYPQTLAPYLGRLVGTVEYAGELQFGVSHLPEDQRVRRFPSIREFAAAWNTDSTVYLLVHQSDLPSMQRELRRPGTILLQDGKLLWVVNR